MSRLFVLVLFAFLALTAEAVADDKVQIELSGLADDVAKILAKQDQKEIALGAFVGRGKIPSHFGPEIQRILIAEFTRRKIGVSREALIEINGDYRPADENPEVPNLRELFIRINAELVNTKSGKKLPGVDTISRAAYGNEALAKAFAPNVSLPPAADRNVRNEELKRRIERPETHAIESKVRSVSTSPFAVELLVVSALNAADPVNGRAVSVKDGLAFIDIKKTEYYRVKIHNGAPFDVAVRLSIDGLDQFVFADRDFCDGLGKAKFEYMVVPRGKSAVIRGWFRNLKSADSFVVTEYAKSAAAALSASQGEIGQICVQFHAAWDTKEELTKEGGKDAATGRGEPVDVNLVPVKRFIGAMRDQVAIRYSK